MTRSTRGVAAVLVALWTMQGCGSHLDLGVIAGKIKKEIDGAPQQGDHGLAAEESAAPGADSRTDVGSPRVDVPRPSACTLTPGYWKNHPDDARWLDFLVIAGRTYTKSQLITLLSMPTRGDASLTLARHLISAILNGGTSDPVISDTIDDALDWIAANQGTGRLPVGTARSTADHREATALADILAAYNEGLLGPPQCD